MCTLRAWGKNFKVETFLAGSRWKPSRVYHRGRTASKPNSDCSGFNLGISDGSWKSLAGQAKDAIRWLGKNGAELHRLMRSRGLEGAVLDFPIRSRLGGRKNILVQSDRIPAA